MLTVAEPDDRLILRPLDLQKTLQESDVDYLFVESLPRTNAQRGTKYEYEIKALGRQGGLTFSLQGGPEGMQLSPNGLLSWNVPNDYQGSQVPIIAVIRDKAGQEVFHSFHLQIE